MIITTSSDSITVQDSTGGTVLTIANAANWNQTLAGMILTDSDGSQWQWDIPSQSFLEVSP